MSDTQMHLNRNLEIVAQTFQVDLLQHMEKNTKLDMQFINDSRQRYEKEYRHRTASIDKCMSDLWRMERTRDKNTREIKENMMHLHTEMQAFVSESQQAAELEEKRRYRFLAEKHQFLSNTFLQFYTRARAVIQKKAQLWKEQLEATRNPSQNLLSPSHNQGHSSGRVTPTHVEVPQRPLADVNLVAAGRGFSPFPQETPEILPPSQPEPRRRPLSRTPSVGSLSTGQHSRSSSFGEKTTGGGAETGSKEKSRSSGLKVQAIAPHVAGSNPTLLQLNPGDIVSVLVPEAQNGWLYGKLEGASMSGWFPEAFVKPLEEMRDPEEATSRTFPLRGSHRADDLLDRPSTPSVADYRHNPSRPQSPSPSPAQLGEGNHRSSTANASATTESKKVPSWEHPPELFPKGTNPFATVKLRPTMTNDRSAPIIK